MKKYKTLKGFIRGHQGQVSIKTLFGCKAWLSGKWQDFELSDEALTEASTLVSTYLYVSKGARSRAFEALKSGRGDTSLFESFYIQLRDNKELFVNSSLGGEGFDSCKNRYSRSIY